MWTHSVAGKTQGHQLASPELEKVRRELANYKEFVALSEQLVEVNEAICEARPISPLAEEAAPTEPVGEKGGSPASSRRRSPPR